MRLMNFMTVALVLMTVSTAADQANETDDEKYKSNRVRLMLTNRQQLDNLSAEAGTAQSDTKQPVTVTDLMLDVSRIDKKIENSLRAADGEVIPGHSDMAFTAEFYAVAGGRLYSEASALCSAFAGDVSSCHIDCDGGGFQLQRKAVAEGFALSLIVGKAEGSLEADGGSFIISDCGESDTLTIGSKNLAAPVSVDFARKY